MCTMLLLIKSYVEKCGRESHLTMTKEDWGKVHIVNAKKQSKKVAEIKY